MSRKRKRPYSPTRAKQEYWQTAAYQDAVYQNYRDSIVQLAVSRFKWINLPRSCDPRYLEMTLLNYGCASIAFPKERPGLFMGLKATQIGAPNMYGIPSHWQAMGESGKTHYPCDWTNGVFVLDSRTQYPLMSKINIWARELSHLHTTQLINNMHMRMPMTISGPQTKAGDMQQFYATIANGEPFNLVYDSFDNQIKADVTLPNKRQEYIGDLLDIQFSNKWSEIYRELGVKNLPYKSERMIQDEVDVTAEPATMTALSPLEMRRESCRKLNERFSEFFEDAPIACVWNSDIGTANFNFTHSLQKLEEGEDVDR